MNLLISWDAPEHHHTEKNNDWYWAVGIITFTSTALAFIFGNVMFGILIIIGVFSLLVHAAKKPDMVHVEINDRGIVVDKTLYTFLNLESFWIDAHVEPAKIILKSTKTFMPYVTIYITDVNKEKVREILLKYIAETEHSEPLSQIILERFGF